MSFHTKLQIQMLGSSEPVDFQNIEDSVLALLKVDGIHKDVYSDLRSAFGSGEADFNLHAAYLLVLVRKVAKILTDKEFEARCLGEEFRHTWIAAFRNGREIFCQGPWDYEGC